MNIIRITTATTTVITNQTCLLRSLRLVFSGTTTDARATVQDKDSPAHVFYVSDELDAPATIQVPFPESDDKVQPVAMKGGIDIVTTGTIGDLDVWLDQRPSNQ